MLEPSTPTAENGRKVQGRIKWKPQLIITLRGCVRWVIAAEAGKLVGNCCLRGGSSQPALGDYVNSEESLVSCFIFFLLLSLLCSCAPCTI
ncbi:hypothetical protein K504DRAFT_290344 [Pleomassaria siparia CBS 279.74]|uniref:Uncharacterized protein n=1 Tax=Pleomassaria siparia CBS 279.74 TaxID=1314801 RepID=A0A6G1K7J5_9PLEO|nr:hypothetical protein K504DRAFT_290344 [Pleomassaria siparia CBS 279.74]